MYHSIQIPRRLVVACCGLAVWAAGGSAEAQNRRGVGNRQLNPAAGGAVGGAISVQIDGTLMAGNTQAIRVQQNDGSVIAVQLPTDVRRISYAVELTPAELRPGMMVRFRTDMKSIQAGVVQPQDLELFSAEDRRGVNTRNPRERAQVMPGIYPLAQLGEVLPQSDEVRVVGQIAGAKDAQTMIVNAGRQVLVELAEDAALRYRTTSLKMAKPGDSVTGSGITYNAQSGQVIASQLTVQAAGSEPAEEKAVGETDGASAEGQTPAAEGTLPGDAAASAEGGPQMEAAQGATEKPTQQRRRDRRRPASP